ncbi:hypothetical protein EDF71_1302 [Comamonas sp. JUb58]|nr:hypothetical protein EDF71_1302 [Comamonas sp. JUb58]
MQQQPIPTHANTVRKFFTAGGKEGNCTKSLSATDARHALGIICTWRHTTYSRVSVNAGAIRLILTLKCTVLKHLLTRSRVFIFIFLLDARYISSARIFFTEKSTSCLRNISRQSNLPNEDIEYRAKNALYQFSSALYCSTLNARKITYSSKLASRIVRFTNRRPIERILILLCSRKRSKHALRSSKPEEFIKCAMEFSTKPSQ